LITEEKYTNIGTYWEKANQNEIDIVAFNEFTKTALIGDVKLDSKRISISALKNKSANITRELKGYDIEYRGFSLNEM
ncbi:MAG: DUF234 domain-containing protein, partial [Kiritimatiellaeota bacterium]|nr:DUF234 domain-containing protein [Kiritimatiellota bacterium]